MPTIPNYPPGLLDRHHAWHDPAAHPGSPTRVRPAGSPGAGLEFLTFHRDFLVDFRNWYFRQDFASPALVDPWTEVPAEMRRADLGWNSWSADVDRILLDPLSFGSADELGTFIELGVHNNFLHSAASVVFQEPVLATFHSPQITQFYQLHGLVQRWWDHWETRRRTWHHGVPGLSADVPVATGTSPTSWYTTPENVQHIGFVGDDRRIHELFFFIGGDGKWHHNVPGFSSDVLVAPGTNPTSWYTTPENVQHIAFVGDDRRIHELFFFIGGDGRWLHGVPGFASNDLVAPGTSPTSWYTTPENVQHIAFVGDDQRIHELFFFIGGSGGWFHGVPGFASDVPVMPGTSPTSWYTTPENVQHIAYVGVDQRIHELFFFIGGDGQWHHNTPGLASDVPVMPGTSPTSWYTTPENVQHIAYVGTDHRIHELFFFIGGDGQWHHNIPGVVGDPVAPGTSPTSWYTTPENVQHIGYIGTDRRAHELFFFIGGDGRWFHGVPGAVSDVLAAPGTNPTSWYTTPENVQHMAYVGDDRLIHELFYFIR